MLKFWKDSEGTKSRILLNMKTTDHTRVEQFWNGLKCEFNGLVHKRKFWNVHKYEYSGLVTSSKILSDIEP